MKKLKALKALRATMTRDIDRDIATLENALGLVGENSS